MAKEKLIVQIHPNGQIEIDVKGVKGKGCTHLADALAKQIGSVVNQTKTLEYYQSEATETTKIHSQ